MHNVVNAAALDQTFRNARTHSRWKPEAISAVILRSVYDLARMGPTSANCCPARFVYVQSRAAKEKLRPALEPGNVDKTMQAPCTVIIGVDEDFVTHMPKLFPHADTTSWFADPDVKKATAWRNGTLQGGYFIIAARMLGLDCGPMSGFDAAALDEAFFAGTSIKSNFLCNVGYCAGDPPYPRCPRQEFDEVCKII